MFYEGVSISEANLFAITETGCNDSVHDSELIPPGYHIIRCDRADGRKQGGACLVATPRFELRRMAIPETWKLTRVVPIPKGKMSSNVEGYRPVAILSTPAKVLEAAVHKRLYAQVSA
ncbi:unnamed protein product [Euphydryas editha]|uniref:Uncharacterized protein n=1 Tax=Euphydryas editha TaxID=104508 RepID=A0AAU9UHQ7_EUPED|nr:unnamed protein product [Euphydryas editha]